MKPAFGSVEGVLALVGKPLANSEWVVISQERINQFAEATGDHQWIHCDPVKAAAGPFGACIAHGYLSLSLVASFQEQMATLENLKMGVNYGSDKVRFPSAVKVGSRLRGKGELIAAEKTKDGGVQAIIRVTVEIEGAERPACVAETISRYYFN